MFCKQQNSYALKGLLISGFFLAALIFGNSGFFQNHSSNSLTEHGSIQNQSYETRGEENTSNITINFENQPSSPFAYLIQIMFWLFFISPPVIVVLLLVIISKMNSKNSVK